MSELHSYGVVHGDLAMRNILVDKDDRVCVVDFEHSICSCACTQQVCDLDHLDRMWDKDEGMDVEGVQDEC